MKKIVIALLFLSANIEIAFAKTGTVSDDNVVIWGPLLVLTIIWAGYRVKGKLKERKEREAEKLIEPNTTENSSPAE